MKNILQKIDEACLVIASVLFFLIFAVSIIEIILRSFFNFSLLWTMDLCVMLASWTILLGASSALHRSDHLVVDFLINKMSPFKSAVIRLVGSILFLAFLLILIYNGIYVSILKMDIYYTSLRWPSGIAYIALPVFGFISTLFILERIFTLVNDIKKLLTSSI